MTAQMTTFMSRGKTRTHHQIRSEVKPAKVNLGQDYYDEVGDAKERDEYYAGVKDGFSSSDGKELYQTLNRLVKSTHTNQLNYKTARKHLYGEVDRRPDGGLYYIYSGEGPKNEEEFTGPAKSELTGYNCEHGVPQSWFGKKSTPKADIHHLFTEQVQCNGSRGNFPLGEVENGKEIESCGIVQERGRGFEPHAGKGELARATMYFVTRYPGEVGNSNNEMKHADLAELLKWHKEYPVTDFERHRNETIQDAQGNRNPFIDFPELAEKVDFSLGFAG